MAKLTTLGPALGVVAPRLGHAPKIVDNLYRSPEWRALLRSIKLQRGPFCQRCGSMKRVIGDHIRELRDGGAPLDPRNVELLCIGCHNAKTAKARAARAGRG